MRILIATPLYPPEIGGPATHTKMLEEELPKHGIGVIVVAFRDVRYLPKGIRHIAYFIKLVRRGREADVIYALDPVSVGLPALVASKLLKKRFIVRIAGDYAWEQGVARFGIKNLPHTFSKKFDEYPLPVRILKRIQQYVAIHAGKIIVPSYYLKKVISNWSVDDGKIVVVYNGFDGLPHYGNRSTLRGLLKFGGKLIVTAGRLISLKRFDMLVQIMPELRMKFPDLKLMIIGEGPEEENLEKQIEKLGLGDNVVLAGALEQEVFFRYIHTADVLVLNSMHETFPNVVLEAMSIGTPVVATKVGGVPEIIEDNKDGLLVKSGDREEIKRAISRALSDKNFSGTLVRNAKHKLKKFTIETTMKKIVRELRP